MKKFASDTLIVTLDGKPIDIDGANLTVGRAISGLMINTKEKTLDPFKSWKIAQRCYDGGVIDMDEADYAAIKELVQKQGRQVYSDLILGQILEALSEAKELEMIKGQKA